MRTFARSHGSHIASSSFARAAIRFAACTLPAACFDTRRAPALLSMRAYASSFARFTCGGGSASCKPRTNRRTG